MKLDKINIIMWLSIIFIIIFCISFPNNIFSFGILILIVSIVAITMYKNASKITNLSEENVKLKTFKNANILTFLFIIIITITNILNSTNKISEKMSNNILLITLTLYFIYFGNISPKIPFNRYFGLRLPWTVRDEDTWRYAHKLLGYISFPACIIMFLVGFYYDLFIGILIWLFGVLIIPSILSFNFYYKKYKI